MKSSNVGVKDNGVVVRGFWARRMGYQLASRPTYFSIDYGVISAHKHI